MWIPNDQEGRSGMYVFMCLHLSLHMGDAPLDIYIFGN